MSGLYRQLLRLYPREVRERLGEAMAETFDEEWSEVRTQGKVSRVLFALRTVVRTPLLALEERVRAWTDGWSLGAWATDFGHAARSVRRSPGFFLVTVLTVALGVGATASIYAVADATLLRELPVQEPDRLVRFAEERDRYNSFGPEGPRISVDRYDRLREALTGSVFSGFAGHNPRTLSIRADGPAFSATGELTSGNYFRVLGLRPAVGRFFTTGDEASVVLGHRLWRSRFGGDPGVVGRTLSIAGLPFVVIGVAPADFASTVGFQHIDFFVPVGAYEGAGWPVTRLSLFGRLAPDVVLEAAERRAAGVVMRLSPEDDPRAEILGAELTPMTPTPASMAGALTRFLAMLFAMALLVLIIAGANVAGILVARGVRREGETAVRLALGVGRGRLVRQSMIEAVGLFAVGGLVGAGIAVLVGEGLSRISLPIADTAAVDAVPGLGTLAFALAVATLAGLVFGTMPALHAARSEVVSGLRDGARGTSPRATRARGVFVTAQLALSVVLLVAATLFARTAQRSMTADLGFDPEGVVVAQVDLGPHGYSEEEGRVFFDRLVEEVRALPGVESASLASIALMTGEILSKSGWRVGPDDEGKSVRINQVDGRYFETMDVDVAAGRGIAPGDGEGAPHVVVVNESFARRFWPGERALGKTILRDDTPYEVVGVTPDGRYVDFGGGTSAFAFLSIAQHYAERRTLHLRIRPGAEPAELIRYVRERVAGIDRDVAVQGAMPLTRAMESLLFPQRFAAALIGVFGLLGLFLAATGVYGVLTHHVVRRTREFGVRIALGAEPGRLLGRVLGRTAVLAGIGALVGVAFAAGVTRLLAGFLLELSPYDPVAFVGVPLLLGLVALAASALPTRRILRLDPVDALRRE